MMKFIKRAFALLTAISIIMVVPVHAAEIPPTATPHFGGEIDADIYEMVNAYENGTLTQSNNEEAMQIFNAVGANDSNNSNVNYIYSNKQTGTNTFVATQIALYSLLEKEEQDELNNVVLFCRIEYQKKDFGQPWDYIMLTKVAGGVVRNDSSQYWCEFLYLKYSVQGVGFDEKGNKQGYKSNSVNYGGAVNSPKVGTEYYIAGPSDYYYDMGDHSSMVVGFTKGVISRRLSSSTDLEVGCAIEPI